jgi:hypothetical protein
MPIIISYAAAFLVDLFFRRANQLLDYLPRCPISFMLVKPQSVVF